MQSLAAGRLGEALETDAEECLAHLDGRVGDALPTKADVRIEIEGDDIRSLKLFDCRAPRMDFEHPHLHHRDEAGEVFDVGVSTRAGACALWDLDPADDLGHRDRRVLLIEAFLSLPFWAAHQA